MEPVPVDSPPVEEPQPLDESSFAPLEEAPPSEEETSGGWVEEDLPETDGGQP